MLPAAARSNISGKQDCAQHESDGLRSAQGRGDVKEVLGDLQPGADWVQGEEVVETKPSEDEPQHSSNDTAEMMAVVVADFLQNLLQQAAKDHIGGD